MRRLCASNRDDARLGPPLDQLRSEIEADRADLESAMDRLGIRRSCLKPAAAWAAEKVGRLKLNGQLTGYSPLSRLVELEGLCIGIAGKERMWKALARTRGERLGELDLTQLAQRAASQRTRVEELHAYAASLAFSGASEPEVASSP